MAPYLTIAERLTALQQQRDQTVAALNQIAGAIAILEQIQKEDAEKIATEKALTEQPTL
jgi:hypothetical protein